MPVRISQDSINSIQFCRTLFRILDCEFSLSHFNIPLISLLFWQCVIKLHLSKLVVSQHSKLSRLCNISVMGKSLFYTRLYQITVIPNLAFILLPLQTLMGTFWPPKTGWHETNHAKKRRAVFKIASVITNFTLDGYLFTICRAR